MTGTGTGTGTARLSGADVWPAVRVALVVLWVVWAGLAWWTAPRAASVDQARADLDGGRAVLASFQTFVDGPAFLGPRVSATVSPADALFLVWRTEGWRVHYVAVTPAEKTDLQQRFDESRAATPTFGWVGNLTLLLVVAGLAILFSARDPVKGTRWYWFWLGGVPFGLGILYWLALERPWAQPRPPAADPVTGIPRRRNGVTGFITMVLAGVVASILVAVLRDLLGPVAVPGPF